MTVHFDEHTIDLFTLNPSLLNESTREALGEHIRECSGCRALVDSLRSFYAELHISEGNTLRATPHQEDVLRSLLPDVQPIKLLPYHLTPTSAPTNGHQIFVLAAQSTTREYLHRFVTVATLANKEEQMLMRLVHDGQTNRFTAYLHSEDVGIVSRAIVSIKDPSLSLVLDEKGQVEFALAEEARPSDWSSVETVVRPAMFSVKIESPDLASGGPVRLPHLISDFEIWVQHRDDQLEVRVEGRSRATACSTLLFDFGPGSTILVEPKGGIGRVQVSQLPESFTLRLYP